MTHFCCISSSHLSVHCPYFTIHQHLVRPHNPGSTVTQSAFQCFLITSDQYRYGRYRDFVRQPVIQKQSSNLLTVSHHRTVAILFYSLQFCHYIPCNKLHSFILSQVDSIVRYNQSLFRCNWPAQMIHINAQVSFFINQHATGGIHRCIEILVRRSLTTVDRLVHVQSNLFHINNILMVMFALYPKEQRELILYKHTQHEHCVYILPF
nr:MAG TPA: hypothetical protein [Bacteriophage sp.]